MIAVRWVLRRSIRLRTHRQYTQIGTIALEAPSAGQISVKVNHFVTSCSLMQIIDVLSDDCHMRQALCQREYCQVRIIGLCFANERSTPGIPSPYQPWISFKCSGRGQSLRIVLCPETSQVIAKGGDTTFCRDACTGKNDNMPGSSQALRRIGKYDFRIHPLTYISCIHRQS